MEFRPTQIFHTANRSDLLSSRLPARPIDGTFQPAVDHRDSFFTPWTLSIPHKWPLITLYCWNTLLRVWLYPKPGEIQTIPASQHSSGFILKQCPYPSVRSGITFPFPVLHFFQPLLNFYSLAITRFSHRNTLDEKEKWHLSVTRVPILQMGRFPSLWLVATLFTSTSLLPLDRRHLCVARGEMISASRSPSLTWEIMC